MVSTKKYAQKKTQTQSRVWGVSLFNPQTFVCTGCPIPRGLQLPACRQVFWLSDHPTNRPFPSIKWNSGCLRFSSLITAAGPLQCFTEFPVFLFQEPAMYLFYNQFYRKCQDILKN